ncbi:MAG: Efflux ABC transporter, ATP-binding protein [uncultured Gemmatimonadetes bacterium]|uniref:Efflux ABC transporter, ATP-binding protein n=1 Tax=uncultured Gemmatimonadota bacterium TaxID=203437 RepID=A0A6J4K620_9BACT|nr:MAG: Efflux ABC transporter, ATP-binding protein [uncultured Gemmatimonadota bacterium]
MTAALPIHLADGPFAVATQGLTKRFGRETALRGVDLQVPEGAVYVLVGPNGAGKSTTLRVLLDLLRADEGRAEVLGLDPRTRGPEARAQIGYVPERHDWGYGWMRVGRLMEHHAVFFPTWDREYAVHLARAFDLRLDRKLGKLSKGQARRVQLALALAHRPRLLVLDEPTDGLDPVMRDETLGLLAEHIAETPTTVLISTHVVHEVDRLADHLGVMRDGRLVIQAQRDLMHRMLRRYRADVPEGWSGAPGLNGTVLRQGGIGREIQWSIWGEEREVVERLTRAGATVRAAAPLTLEDAALALLSRKES